MPKKDTQFGAPNGNKPGTPKGTKHKKSWERIDDRMRRGGLAILAPFKDAKASKAIEAWVVKYSQEETEKYIRDIFTPYVKALPPEIRVKVYQSLIQVEGVADNVKMMQVVQFLLLEIEALGGNVEAIKAKLPAEID